MRSWWSASSRAPLRARCRSTRSWRVASGLALGLALGACALVSGRDGLPKQPPRLDPDLVQRGAILFMDARLSGDKSRSCAACHPGSDSDRRYYRAGALVEPGPGAARTLSLRGLWQTAPYLWDGSAATLAAAVDRMLAVEMQGGALAGKDREALEAYLLSLPPLDRGRVQPDGAPVEPATLSARRGFAVFTKVECDACHLPPAFATPGRRDVGTGGALSVPTLRGVGALERLGRDGRWPDLESAVIAHAAALEATLGADELAQLVAYLKLL